MYVICKLEQLELILEKLVKRKDVQFFMKNLIMNLEKKDKKNV